MKSFNSLNREQEEYIINNVLATKPGKFGFYRTYTDPLIDKYDEWRIYGVDENIIPCFAKIQKRKYGYTVMAYRKDHLNPRVRIYRNLEKAIKRTIKYLDYSK